MIELIKRADRSEVNVMCKSPTIQAAGVKTGLIRRPHKYIDIVEKGIPKKNNFFFSKTCAYACVCMSEKRKRASAR